MARVNEGLQFYLPPPRLSINAGQPADSWVTRHCASNCSFWTNQGTRAV